MKSGASHLPEDLGHVELLCRAEIKEEAGAVHVAEAGLELGPLDPGRRVGGVVLEVFLVDGPDLVKLPELRGRWESICQQPCVKGLAATGRGSRTLVRSSMYALKSFSLGHMPMAVPRIFLAAVMSLCRSSK